MFLDLWRRETLISLWQRTPAQGAQMDHMTTFLAQTAVDSICTIYDLLLFSSVTSKVLDLQFNPDFGKAITKKYCFHMPSAGTPFVDTVIK